MVIGVHNWAMAKSKKYTVNDGTLLLTLEEADGGWYTVTSPMDPALITQAKSLPEAFEMAYDARKTLIAARKKLARQETKRRAAS